MLATSSIRCKTLLIVLLLSINHRLERKGIGNGSVDYHFPNTKLRAQ